MTTMMNLQTGIFLSLNAALVWWAHGANNNNNNNIPRRDAVLTLITILAVATFHTIFPSSPSSQQVVVVNKSKLYNTIFPLLSLSELVVFLIVPWVLLVTNKAQLSSDTTVVENYYVPYILTSHLLHIQTQIALEPIVSDHRRRLEAHYWFIAATNGLLRGIGIATWVVRYYTEIRPELIMTRDSSTTSRTIDYLDAYTAIALLVWMAANLIIALVWRPCLSVINPYKDSVVILTGAASGIGKALAENVVERGAKAVVLVDRQKALAEELAARLVEQQRRRGGADIDNIHAVVYDVDVRNYSEMKRIMEETKKTFGTINFLFNNAGILIIGPIETIGVENFDYIFDVNVKGVHNGVQAAYPIMKEQGFGHIINTSSLLGLIPGGQWAVAYSASKHAVVGLTTNLRIEAAKHGVRVSLFCPGTIETPIHTGGAYGKNLTGIPPAIWDKQLAKMNGMDSKSCAVQTLDAVAKNKAMIVVPEIPMIQSRLLYRLSPSLWLDRAVAKVDWRREMEAKKVTGAESAKSENTKKNE